MDVDSITRIAGLIGEPGRIQMLIALLDGNGHPASDLALAAAVSPQTASSHLSKLLAGGLVTGERIGRQRIFHLSSPDVAHAVEALGALAQTSLAGASAAPQIRFARTCYDHLAGMLAIALRDELLKKEALHNEEGPWTVTASGVRLLRTLDIDVDSLQDLRRSFAYHCLDWTERHHHIGGALGAALLSHFFRRKWLVRIRNTRAVRVTDAGELGFYQVLGIRCSGIRIPSSVNPASSVGRRAGRGAGRGLAQS